MRTPSAPFEPLPIRGESITLDTSGTVLVLPSGDPTKLIGINEYTLTEGRNIQDVGTYTLTTELQDLITPWIAIYDPSDTIVDFYLFLYKPTELKYIISSRKLDEAQFQTADEVDYQTADEANFIVGVTENYISSLILYPGNGLIYYGQITYCDLTRDSDSDLVPDVFGRYLTQLITSDGSIFTTADGAVFDFSVPCNGSLLKFLESYSMVVS